MCLRAFSQVPWARKNMLQSYQKVEICQQLSRTGSQDSEYMSAFMSFSYRAASLHTTPSLCRVKAFGDRIPCPRSKEMAEILASFTFKRPGINTMSAKLQSQRTATKQGMIVKPPSKLASQRQSLHALSEQHSWWKMYKYFSSAMLLCT